jgi:hypothetical protein
LERNLGPCGNPAEQQLDVLGRTFHGAMEARSMSNVLTGSRYELRVSRDGAKATHDARSYYDVYRSDAEEGGEPDHPVGYVHSIEVGSTVDGPGIRFVLFLTGCPLRCQFCHNPDTWHKANGRQYTLDKIMKEIGKYAPVLTISRGGLTISGGEAVMQDEFTTEVFRRTKILGMHTCLATSGLLGSRLTDAALEGAGLGPIRFFEWSVVGVPLLAGTVAIILVFGRFLLPERRSQSIPADFVATASELGVSALPLLIGVAMGAGASFLTPVGTPVNLMVQGPGGYQFGDYWKLGLIVMLWSLIVAVFIAPLYWRF